MAKVWAMFFIYKSFSIKIIGNDCGNVPVSIFINQPRPSPVRLGKAVQPYLCEQIKHTNKRKMSKQRITIKDIAKTLKRLTCLPRLFRAPWPIVGM